MRPSPLRERADGSCDRGSVCYIEDEPRQILEEAEGSPPSSAAHSQRNPLNQGIQNNTEVRGISIKELLWKKAIGQQQCQQNEQEDEQKDDIEATSGEDKGPISYCQQIKESPQHQRAEEETIVEAPLSQVRQHSVKPYHNENGDNDDDDDDDEDEEVRPPRRRKRRRIDSDATETVTSKKVHTRSSTIAQAQTCTTRGSTVSRSSPGDAESIGADYQEYPLQGFLKCVRIGRETTYSLEFQLPDLPDSFRPSVGLHISNSTSSGESVGGSAHPRVCASHAKRSRPALQKQRNRGRLQYTEQEDNLLARLKKKEGFAVERDTSDFYRCFPG